MREVRRYSLINLLLRFSAENNKNLDMPLKNVLKKSREVVIPEIKDLHNALYN